MNRQEIENEVCEILINHGPDGHVDGYNLLTDFIVELLEKTVAEVCRGAVAATPNVRYNWGYSTCPFCLGETNYEEEDLENIPHTPDCTYLLAKKLLK